MEINDEDIVLHFGKYKGKTLGNVPLHYLQWLAENIKEDTVQNKRICYAADRLYQLLKE